MLGGRASRSRTATEYTGGGAGGGASSGTGLCRTGRRPGAALSLPSTNRASLVQFGLLAWNDDTPYDDLSVGYASLKIEFLER